MTDSLDRSKKFEAMSRQYHLGPAKRVVVTRNLRGKVTVAFPQGLHATAPDELNALLLQVLKDFG